MDRAMAPPGDDQVRIAVMVSGSGTNMDAVIADCRNGKIPGAVVLVVSSNSKAAALEKARKAGIRALFLTSKKCGSGAAFARQLLAELQAEHVDLIVLAGYLKLLPKNVVASYRGRILNIHPGPLPKYGGPGMYGLRVHEAVLAAGETATGPTVHLVDEVYDHGQVIAHQVVQVMPGDTAEVLQKRVLEEEHKLLPHVVASMAREILKERQQPVVTRRNNT